uniref:hypothetical protein n=1 Tax=Pseudomonas viridiflava TaxID=33069 RepID=UPI000F08FE8C
MLAKIVNDYTGILDARGVLEFFASKLAPTGLPYPAGRGALLRAGVRMAHPFETLTPDLVLDAVES